MSAAGRDKTLGKVRGLNSIADPADFKGSSGRRNRRAKTASQTRDTADRADNPADGDAGAADEATEQTATTASTNGAAPPSNNTGDTDGGHTNGDGSGAPYRAIVPGVQRTRRELSVPIPIAEAVEKTGINPADVVMSAYRKHSDAVFTGAGGRLMARGRRRLRLSISDAEFDKLTRLGQHRGWNRSETVAVLLALELLPSETLTD